MERHEPDTSSEFADEGTAAHELAQYVLTDKLDADSYIGETIAVGERTFTVDEDMAGFVQSYVDHVLAIADGGELLVEQRVDFSRIVGVAGSFGTSDAIILRNDEFCLVDLKYGRGVRVDADENEQLLLYALGALDSFGLSYDFKTVRLVIVQPRLDHISEWTCDLDYLGDFAQRASAAAARAIEIIGLAEKELAWPDDAFAPGEKQCRFCKAKAVCPALADEVKKMVVGDFADLTAKDVALATDSLDKVFSDALAQRLSAVDLIESWCKAVRARAEAELLAGQQLPGFKLVEGRRGHRKWIDAKAVEDAMKSMRFSKEQMYDFSLISPATAEKLCKDSPRRWGTLAELITQPPGKPSVAPDSDKRPALNVADDFEAIEEPNSPEGV